MPLTALVHKRKLIEKTLKISVIELIGFSFVCNVKVTSSDLQKKNPEFELKFKEYVIPCICVTVMNCC